MGSEDAITMWDRCDGRPSKVSIDPDAELMEETGILKFQSTHHKKDRVEPGIRQSGLAKKAYHDALELRFQECAAHASVCLWSAPAKRAHVGQITSTGSEICGRKIKTLEKPHPYTCAWHSAVS